MKVAEYFAGIGLVRMGLQPHGWRVVFANDISPKKREMYEVFFPEELGLYRVGDVFGLDPTSIPSSLLATCSFPCIDLSLAGNMCGIVDGSHSSAFWGFVRVLEAQGDSAPPLVLVENVPGWLYSNAGRDFRITVEALNRLGYVCDVFALDARRFTPQSRLRIFLVGSRFLAATAATRLLLARPKSLLPDQLRACIAANKDLRWFANDIPEPPPFNADGLSRLAERLGDSDSRWWPSSEVQRHLAMMTASHRDRVARLANVGRLSYRTFYRRIRAGGQRAEVRNDDLAGCLRTAVGGSGKQFLVVAGEGRIRMRTMTPREYARLQGVPDEYPIAADGVQALTGFGDAVCVPAISWIAANILNPIAESRPVQPSRRRPHMQLALAEW